MTNGSLPMPLYHQVAAVLRQRVIDAEYRAGDRLASEDELAAEFGVSRATIRQAVGHLVDEGYVVRKQGSGTRPAGPPDVLQQRFRGSLGDLIRESHAARTRNIEVKHEQKIADRIAQALHLSEPVGTVVKRTRMMSGEPFAYTVTYLPSDIGSALTVEKLKKGALMEVIMREGTELAAATQSIRAQLADADLCARIDVELGAALLYVERIVTDKTGRPVEFVRSWYRGDRYEYTVNLELSDSVEELYRNLA